MPLEQMITDRTQADVDKVSQYQALTYANLTAQQKAEWDAATLKGSWNYTDLNRVIRAIHYIADLLHSYGYLFSISALKQWQYNEDIYYEDIQVYLKEIAVLRNQIEVFETTPIVPYEFDLSYQIANDLEKILVDLDSILTSMGKVFILAGMPWAYAGNEVYIRND